MKRKVLFFISLLFFLMTVSAKSSSHSVLAYAALVSQGGLGNPHADEIYIDNLEASLTYSRVEQGHYLISSSPCIFMSGKTFTLATPQWGSPVIIGISQMSACQVAIEIYKIIDSELSLSDFWGIQIEIRIYP